MKKHISLTNFIVIIVILFSSSCAVEPFVVYRVEDQQAIATELILEDKAFRIDADLFYDFDGDGHNDSIDLIINTIDNSFAELKISLATGDIITCKYPGYWRDIGCELSVADINHDDKSDIVLFLEEYGSNYGGGNAYVCYVENGKIVNYPDNFLLENGKIATKAKTINDYDFITYFTNFNNGDGFVTIGAFATKYNEADALCLKALIDAKSNSAWQITALYTENGWNPVLVEQSTAFD